VKAGESWVVQMQPEFRRSEIIRYMGGARRGRASRPTEKKLEFWTKHLRYLIRPLLVYSIRPVEEITGSFIHLEDGPKLRSAKMARALRGSEAVVCFVATIGAKIEEEIRHLTVENHLSDAFIVDTIGSVAVEQLVEAFHGLVGEDRRKIDGGVTLRFSPGYCDWSIDEQRKLFDLIDAELIGVEINHSCLMEPRKSVSGIFGLSATTNEASAQYNPCMHCGKKDCIARRIVA
jgi:hypothetical protein